MKPEEQIHELIADLQVDSRKLILYNDDVNTFDHVIECLVSICDHEVIQAEQCAHLVHHKGKCIVKVGSIEKLKPLSEALALQKLSVEIT